jgi:signal peptidase II
VASGDAEPEAAEAADVPKGRLLRVFAFVALIVLVDQLTKIWAVEQLSDGPIGILGSDVEFRLARNPGGAFGRFQGMTPLLAIGAAIITIVLVRASQRTTDKWTLVGLVLVLGGAMGNLADRIFRAPGLMTGHVVDFVSVGEFPVFNVADSCITIGSIVLIIQALRAPQPEQSPSPP